MADEEQELPAEEIQVPPVYAGQGVLYHTNESDESAEVLASVLEVLADGALRLAVSLEGRSFSVAPVSFDAGDAPGTWCLLDKN